MSLTLHWSTLTLIFYVFLGIFGYFCIKKSERINAKYQYKKSCFNRYYLAFFLVWEAVAVFRYVSYDIGGADAYTYKTYFDICLSSNSGHLYVEHVDFLYKVLNQIVRFFTDDYHWLFVIVYGIIIISYIIFIHEFSVKKMSFVPMMILVYIYLRGFNTIRTNLSVAMILFSIVLLKEKKVFWSIILAISSIFFHKAAIFYAAFIVFYLIYQKGKLTVKGMLAWSIISAMVGYFGQNLIMIGNISFLDSGAYKYYAQMSIGTSFFSDFWKISFPQLVIGAMLLLFDKRINSSIGIMDQESANRVKYIRIMCMYDVIMIPVSFILNIWRGYEYFYIVRLLMWGVLINEILKKIDKKSKIVISILFAIVFISWMCFGLYRTWEDSKLMPYVFEFLVH